MNPATGELWVNLIVPAQDQAMPCRGRRLRSPLGMIWVCASESLCCASFSGMLHEKKSEIAAAITREAGKPWAEALVTEVLVVLDAARF